MLLCEAKLRSRRSFRGCAPRGGLFFTIEPRQDTASLDGAGIGGNIDLRRVSDIDAANSHTLRSAPARRRCAYVEPQKGGRREVDDLPAVNISSETTDLLKGRWRLLIDDPAGDGNSVRRAGDFHPGMLGECQIADGGVVNESKVRQIEQIIDDKLPVRVDMEIVAFGSPIRIVKPMEIRNSSGIGERRVAHPDPNPVIAFDHRIASYLRSLRNLLLPWDVNAMAIARKAQSVIEALQRIIHKLAHRQRQMAMGAAVLEGHRSSVFGPKQNDRVAQDYATHWFAADLRIGRCDVPIISQEHGHVLHAARRALAIFLAFFFWSLCRDYNPI